VVLLIRRAEVGERAGLDVRIADGHVVEIGSGLRAAPGDQVHDAAGGALLPGLHDHHVHLRAAAAAASSVHVGPPDVRDGGAFRRRLRQAAGLVPPGAWIRAIGYHESVAGALDRSALDGVVADRPVRVQHRSGVLWVLNSAAIEGVRLDACGEPGVERDPAGNPTGRLWRMDAWLRAAVPAVPADVGSVSAAAAAAGITGLTDATPHPDPGPPEELRRAVDAGVVRQRLHLMSAVGVDVRPSPRVSVGPVKVLLDDDTLPGVGELASWIGAAHAEGRPAAVHCVTRVQLVAALTAFDDAGARRGDRIEHGSLVARPLIGALGRLGLTVVTQPNFVAERGDRYRVDVDPEDLPDLYRCRSLIDAGVAVAAGTDAPFGRADPWAAMRAAAERRTADGEPLGPGERVTPRRALDLFLGAPEAPGRPRVLEVGAPADLCLLRAPLAVALVELDASLVAATFVGGQRISPG